MRPSNRLLLGLLCTLPQIACGAANPASATDDPSTSSASPMQNGSNDVGGPLNDAVVDLNGVCTATLVTANWAITAAHCVNDWSSLSGRYVGVGVNRTSAGSPNRYAIDRCFMHPRAYDQLTPAPANAWRCGSVAGEPWMTPPYDIALVRLSRAVPRANARPMRVLLANPRAGYGAWQDQEVTLRGWGFVRSSGAPAGATWPTVRQVGFNTLDAVGADFAWVLDRTKGPSDAGVGSLVMPGDSGGPLIWYPTSTTPTILGITSGGSIGANNGETTASWFGNTTLTQAAAWINSVMSAGTDTSAQSTSGNTQPPAGGWQGEGADGADNCPNRFNPWQTDSDGDGIGDECDAAPSSSWWWGAARFEADGRVTSTFNGAGAPNTATVVSPGRYTVTLRRLGLGAGNVQVVATGTAPTRCKVAFWGRTGDDESIDVRCHDATTGAPAASPFVVTFGSGATSHQGAYLYYDRSAVNAYYSWNSAGGSNGVTRWSQGRYSVTFGGFTNPNRTVHVTAYGPDAEHCNVEAWGSSSAVIGCYDANGGPVDSAFSFMTSEGATRSDMVGGHAWISGGVASSYYQYVRPSAGCAVGSSVSVSDAVAVTYPATLVTSSDRTFPLVNAYGIGNSGFCKIESWGPNGSGTTVRSKCFTARGVPTTSAFVQSYTASTPQGPC